MTKKVSHLIPPAFRRMVFKSVVLACAGLQAGCQAESNSAGVVADVPTVAWQLSADSSNKLFRVYLACTTPPAVGPFQDCTVQLLHADGKPVLGAKLAVDGGMPAHGHGLPTAPVAGVADAQGHYRIEGLQYSMPGSWLLGFMISAAGGQDKVVFNFTIKP